VYDASGRKLRKLSTTNSTTTVTEYDNGIQYEYSNSSPVISFIQTEEGRARKTGIVYKYEYDLKDLLGDTRLTTTWDPSDANQLTPLNSQRNDYYAFGYTIQSLIGSLPSSPNHYLYNHKELQDETGLYDYGARFYDPVIARWGAVDPLSEKSRRWSSYNYCEDNPVGNIDPDGMEVVVESKNGNLHYRKGKLYDDNGKVYKGKEEFVIKTLGVLRRLDHSKDKYVRAVLAVLERSKQQNVIQDGFYSGNSGTASTHPELADKGQSTSSVVQIFYGQKVDGKMVNSDLLVGHELFHVYDLQEGNMRGQEKQKPSNTNVAEIRAVNFENRIRNANGMPLRTTYGGAEIDPKKLEDPTKP